MEKQTKALDDLIRLSKNDRIAERLKAYDALVDDEGKVDSAVYEAATNCLVRR